MELGQKENYVEKIPLSPILSNNSIVDRDEIGQQKTLFTTDNKSYKFENKDNNVYKPFYNCFNEENNLVDSMEGLSEDEDKDENLPNSFYSPNENNNKTIVNKKEEPKEEKIMFKIVKINNLKNKKDLLGKKTKKYRKYKNLNYAKKYNAFQKICTVCLDKINESIQNEIDLYLMEKNIKMDSKLYKPAITPLPRGIENKVNFIKMSIIDYYSNYTKQRLNEKRKDKNKNKISNKSRNKSRNEEIINKLKKIDLNMEEKKFEMIFNTPFKDYLLAFVNDEEEFIIKEGQNSISFKFKTFKDCFDDDKNANNNKKKEKFKKYIIRKLNRNVKEEKK